MKNSLVMLGCIFAVVATATAGHAKEDQGPRFIVALDGASEVPGPGDADGIGNASIRIDTKRGQLCYNLTVNGIAPSTMAHIHEAPAGSSGPVVFHLSAPSSGNSQGCIAISRDQAAEFVANPGDYYINVHNREFPGGAVRGQLIRVSN